MHSTWNPASFIRWAIIGPVQPHVVVLPERALAVVGCRDRLVFVGALAAEIERDHHGAPAARRGDASQLRHRRPVVIHVLEHVRAEDRVKACVGKVDRRDVDSEVDPWLSEIGGDVPQPFYLLKTPSQRPLGREVQQRAGAGEQLGATLEQEPLSAVALV